MQENLNNTIRPCAFSKNYVIPESQAWLLLKVFYLYRFITANLFVVLYLSDFGPSILGSHDPELYFISSSLYLISTFLSTPLIFLRLIPYVHQAQLYIYLDIIFITFLMHACGGVSSGLGILLVVSTAGGGMLVGGRCAMLFAALASLSVLAEQLYALQTNAFEKTTFTYSGMLGMSYFTTAFLSYVMAKQSERSELLASERQQMISRLENLNRYIIQHLQSGIIICDLHQRIQLSNNAALNLLNLSNMPPALKHLSDSLQTSFEYWLNDPKQNFAILEFNDDNEIQVRFGALNIPGETLFLIILEDVALHNQRLQQNKLASLGHLTASIAHEIRNPLSAISHAGQLLSELDQLNAQDQRLIEIIQTHCKRVNGIIEDILNLSRRSPSKQEKIVLERWLPGFIEGVIHENAYSADSFRLIFTTHPLNTLFDSGHLKQILNNLCSNAIIYSGGKNQIVTIVADLSDETPCIHVMDSGGAISSEIQKHLFEPFFTTSNKGTGLGLYISRELAELNKAKLSYSRKDNQNCFTLYLPNAETTVIEI